MSCLLMPVRLSPTLLFIRFLLALALLQFSIYRPPNYGAMIISVLVLGIVSGMLYAARSYVMVVARKPQLWAWLCIVRDLSLAPRRGQGQGGGRLGHDEESG